MRNCLRCNTEMLEDAALQDRGRVVLTGGLGNFGLFDKFPVKAAVCPNCGEVSLYIEDFKEYAEKANEKGEYDF
ncbi:MAG: nucleic acid-binding protein [Clostridia bacterium]|nr:nucleic acid-binding protein [Clostridia bacterium]